MLDLDNDRPVDFRSPAWEPLFHRLQGNILKGHGRHRTANIFLRFTCEGPKLRDLLRTLAERYVTSAFEQLLQAERYRKTREPGPTFGNLFLTRRTYDKLKLTDRLFGWFPDPVPADQTFPQQASFLDGMLNAAGDLGDRVRPGDAREPLERAYVQGTIDAMVLLADNAPEILARKTDELVRMLEDSRLAVAVAVEMGEVLRNGQDENIEHFGYVDGRSQPRFLRTDFAGLAVDGSIDPATTTEKVPGGSKGDNSEPVDRWNPFAPLSRALLKDRAVADPYAFGSYYVFRKLEQDVEGFLAAENRLAKALCLDTADRARAGAMIVGRFRDGTPLAMSGAEGFTPANANNFRYDGLDAHLQTDPRGPHDRMGLKCPFQSHIRKVNPRQSLESVGDTQSDIEGLERDDRSHAIVRRGIPYGARGSTAGVGLLFACFQSSIVHQFAFMQKKWANTAIFKIEGKTPEDRTGLDPIAGQRPIDPKPPQHWRAEYGDRHAMVREPQTLADLSLKATHSTCLELGGFVTFKGGEFFFAPSLPFLRGGEP